jgi:hypothetical protein
VQSHDQEEIMYKDEMWFRNWSRAVDEHKDDMTSKQWEKFHIKYMLRLGQRIKDFSDGCKTCREYQHPLTRLEEELQELPGSKAQRQYQTQVLNTITDHMVKEHRIAPSNYYLKKMLKYGIVVGLVIGIIVTFFVTRNLLHLPVAIILGAALSELYGYAEDNRIKQEHRIL